MMEAASREQRRANRSSTSSADASSSAVGEAVLRTPTRAWLVRPSSMASLLAATSGSSVDRESGSREQPGDARRVTRTRLHRAKRLYSCVVTTPRRARSIPTEVTNDVEVLVDGHAMDLVLHRHRGLTSFEPDLFEEGAMVPRTPGEDNGSDPITVRPTVTRPVPELEEPLERGGGTVEVAAGEDLDEQATDDGDAEAQLVAGRVHLEALGDARRGVEPRVGEGFEEALGAGAALDREREHLEEQGDGGAQARGRTAAPTGRGSARSGSTHAGPAARGRRAAGPRSNRRWRRGAPHGSRSGS